MTHSSTITALPPSPNASEAFHRMRKAAPLAAALGDMGYSDPNHISDNDWALATAALGHHPPSASTRAAATAILDYRAGIVRRYTAEPGKGPAIAYNIGRLAAAGAAALTSWGITDITTVTAHQWRAARSTAAENSPFPIPDAFSMTVRYGIGGILEAAHTRQ